MSSVPAGKRKWKCPECGAEVLLSMTQLDPIACDNCVSKMKGGGSSGTTPNASSALAGPLGIWSALPETTKLGIVATSLVVGLLIGYVAGKAGTPPMGGSHRGLNQAKDSSSHKDSKTNNDTTADDAETDDSENRTEAPGPGYHWVRGHKRKDGTSVQGHWAKDSHR